MAQGLTVERAEFHHKQTKFDSLSFSGILFSELCARSCKMCNGTKQACVCVLSSGLVRFREQG